VPFRPVFALAGALLLFLPTCGPAPAAKKHPKRVAVLPFENLSGDASLDWAGRGIQIALAGQLRNAADVRGFESGTASGAEAARAELILSGYLARNASGANLHWVVEDASSHKAIQSGQAGPVTEANLLERIQAVTHAVSASAQPSPKTVAALKAFSQGQFEEAVAADSGYGDAWLAWASRLASQGKNAEALAVIERARNANLGKLDLARLKAVEGQIKKDRRLLRDAAVEAAELAGDAASLSQAGQAANATRDFARAESLFRRALEQEPGDEAALNSLAYAQAYQSKFDEALKTIAVYRRVSKDSPNSIDSEGEIQFMSGRFAEAAKTFEQVHQKARDFLQGATLRKAAAAHLYASQLADAQRAAGEYLKEREAARDPVVELNRAIWEYRSARPGDAFSRLAALTRGEPKALGAVAAVELALLRIEEGDFQGARKLALQARQLGLTGQPAALAALCLVIAENDGPAESVSRNAARAFEAPALEGLRQSATGLTLAYRKRFAEAVPFLKAAYERADPANDMFERESYAWVLVETGRFAEAKPLLATWSPPPSENVDLLESLVETRAVYLRALLAENEGRATEANKLFELFIKCHGPRSDRFGRLQRAKSTVTL